MTKLEQMASAIVGEEVRIQKILDKYRIAERDKETIYDSLARIEERTIQLITEKLAIERYRREVDANNVKRLK